MASPDHLQETMYSAGGGKRQLDFDKLLPVRELGEGRSGKVVLVYDCASRTNLALKLIRLPPKVMDHDLLRQLMLEKRCLDIVASCRQCCHCYFTVVSEKYAVFGMKFYPGGSLHDFLDKCVQFKWSVSFKEVQRLVSEMVCAVMAMHESGTWHFDIRGDNILFDKQGHVVLVNFGNDFPIDRPHLAKQNESWRSATSNTSYMAPEMAAGILSVNECEPVDVFSLGVTIESLCLVERQIGWSWSDEERANIQNLVAVMTKENSVERATLRDVFAHSFFRGICWEDVWAGSLDMRMFCPQTAMTELPSTPFHIHVGRLQSRDDIHEGLKNFCSQSKYQELFPDREGERERLRRTEEEGVKISVRIDNVFYRYDVDNLQS